MKFSKAVQNFPYFCPERMVSQECFPLPSSALGVVFAEYFLCVFV